MRSGVQCADHEALSEEKVLQPHDINIAVQNNSDVIANADSVVREERDDQDDLPLCSVATNYTGFVGGLVAALVPCLEFSAYDYRCHGFQQCSLSAVNATNITNPFTPPLPKIDAMGEWFLNLILSGTSFGIGTNLLCNGAYKVGSVEKIWSRQFFTGVMYAGVGALTIGSALALDFVATSVPIGLARNHQTSLFDGFDACQQGDVGIGHNNDCRRLDSPDELAALPPVYQAAAVKSALMGASALGAAYLFFLCGRDRKGARLEQQVNQSLNASSAPSSAASLLTRRPGALFPHNGGHQVRRENEESQLQPPGGPKVPR
jgi:hypothetical protein